MKYKIEEGKISTESTEPKITLSISSSHDQSGNTNPKVQVNKIFDHKIVNIF